MDILVCFQGSSGEGSDSSLRLSRPIPMLNGNTRHLADGSNKGDAVHHPPLLVPLHHTLGGQTLSRVTALPNLQHGDSAKIPLKGVCRRAVTVVKGGMSLGGRALYLRWHDS